MPSPWNSLEVAKLIISLATPALVALLTFQVSRVSSRLQSAQWANQKLIEKRIQIFEQVAPALNDLYCYFRQLGRWKELSPPEIISKKRDLDKDLHVYEVLLSHEVVEAYDNFMGACFQTFIRPGVDAKLRTWRNASMGDRSEAFPKTWETKWNDMFAEEGLSQDDFEEQYRKLMSQFSETLGIGSSKRHPPACVRHTR